MPPWKPHVSMDCRTAQVSVNMMRRIHFPVHVSPLSEDEGRLQGNDLDLLLIFYEGRGKLHIVFIMHHFQ